MYVHKKKFHSSEVTKNNFVSNSVCSDNKLKNDLVDVNDNKSTLVRNSINEKTLNNITLSNDNSSAISVLRESSGMSDMSIKLEKPEDSVSIFGSNIMHCEPNSPSIMLSNLSNDDYEFDSFKQEFSSLENIEPVVTNSSQDSDMDKENSKLKNKKGKSKVMKKTAKKRCSVPTSESCARTYLAYHSNEIVFDEPTVSSSPIEHIVCPVSPEKVNGVMTSVSSVDRLDRASPGPLRMDELSLSSIADLPVASDPDMEPLASDIRDVSFVEADSTTISYNCDTNLSDASSELLINYDNLQESQQPTFFSNFILQVSRK